MEDEGNLPGTWKEMLVDRGITFRQHNAVVYVGVIPAEGLQSC
jgi:hypothetical protein